MYNSGNSSKNVTGSSIVDGTVETVDIADDAVTADKLANSVNTDIGTGVTASTTAGAALPKAGGTMTGTIAGFESTGIDDNATSTAITIDASENVEINTGNLVIGTSGKGIDFSADGNAAGMTSEVLDDYEEGAWTVQFYDASTGGNVSATSANGHYTKIGRKVTASFHGITNISTAGMTAGGNLFFTLPFAAGSQGAGVGSVVFDNVDLATDGADWVSPTVSDLFARGKFYYTKTGAADGIITVQRLTTGVSDVAFFSITYYT
jgi:hypothetical protein